METCVWIISPSLQNCLYVENTFMENMTSGGDCGQWVWRHLPQLLHGNVGSKGPDVQVCQKSHFLWLTFLCQGLFACFCPYRGEAALVQVKFIHRCDNNLNASQCQRHLLRGPRSIGASSSRPGCHLPASSWLCSCTHVRGELQCNQPQQSIGKSCYQIYTLSPVPTKIFQRQLEIKPVFMVVFSFQLQASGNPPTAPPSYEKAVAWEQRSPRRWGSNALEDPFPQNYFSGYSSSPHVSANFTAFPPYIQNWLMTFNCWQIFTKCMYASNKS